MEERSSDPAGSDDQHTLAALRAGDEKAFLVIVQRLHPSMLRVASAFVSSRAVAEEVVQETWLGVLKGLAQFEGRSSLRRWIFGILANCARSRGVREARSVPLSSLGREEDEGPAVDPSRFRPPDDSHWPGHWSAPPVPWAEEQLLRREAVEAAERAVESLPASQRAVITLRDVEGCDSKEVCETLGISEANQRVLLHRARSKVRAALEHHFESGDRR
jgi:RNA polymerase sigma-70 factor, ECF subfamily